MKKKRGQVLILILLVVVVALSVGLSIASRNITNLKTSTQTEQSQRAFTTAEGGLEDVLSQLSNLQSDTEILSSGGKDIPVTVGDLSATVNVKGSKIYESTIELGEVGQIDLETSPALAAGTAIQIEWSKVGESTESDGSGPASLEAVQISGAAPYSQTRYFFRGTNSRNDESVGITGGNFTDPGTCSAEWNSAIFTKCARITTLATPRILRIKPFWARTTVRVYAIAPADLPVQVYDISSLASTSGGVSRKVQVTRTAKPHLPAVFDYALFSESDIIK